MKNVARKAKEEGRGGEGRGGEGRGGEEGSQKVKDKTYA